MSWDNPGSNPLSAIGESIVGDIGGTAEVRLVTGNYQVDGETYRIGLLTSNSDVLNVDVDPVTGELSPIGTDVGFGAPLRRYIQAGVYNGDFASPPPDTSMPISDDNPLPYWRFVPSLSSNITATWVADTASGSGGVLQWYIGPGNSTDDAYIEQLVPVNASRGRNWAYFANAEFGPGWSANGTAAYIAGRYLKSDAVTATGGAWTDGSAVALSTTANVEPTTRPGTAGVVPSDAAWLRLRTGIRRDTAAAATSNSATQYEVWVEDGATSLIVVDDEDPATFSTGIIYQASGTMKVGATQAASVSISSNGALSVGTTEFAAGLTAQSGAVATVPFIARGASGQSADLWQVRANDDTIHARVSAAGRTGIGVNPTNTNGGILQLSGGITFPATAVSASDANTLDDYEEGTWTPAITFATPGDLNVAYSAQSGTYTKIGNRVLFSAAFSTSTFTFTTATGNFRITGLPFAASSATANFSAQALHIKGWTKANHIPTALTQPSQTYLQVYTMASGAASGYLNATHFTSGTQVEVYVSGQYAI